MLDSLSIGAEIVLRVEAVRKRIQDGEDFGTVVSRAEGFFKTTQILFALPSFDNLKKRAHGHGYWVCGPCPQYVGHQHRQRGGEDPHRGQGSGRKPEIELILTTMRERGYQGGRAAIRHCCNSGLARTLADRIRILWKGRR